jgi:alkylated DNA repair dioxygenase AlkB
MRPSAKNQGQLFECARRLPDGLVYRPEFLSTADEETLLAEIRRLPLEEARYKSFTARRRIASFGAGYDFESNALLPAPPLAPFLLALRERVAAWAGIPAAELTQCTIAEYQAGTQLGWHRDVPRFGAVAGVSLASAGRMRLRRYPHVKHEQERAILLLVEARSVYLLRDDARWRWQHAISPTKALRYSITFRTVLSAPRSVMPARKRGAK